MSIADISTGIPQLTSMCVNSIASNDPEKDLLKVLGLSSDDAEEILLNLEIINMHQQLHKIYNNPNFERPDRIIKNPHSLSLLDIEDTQLFIETIKTILCFNKHLRNDPLLFSNILVAAKKNKHEIESLYENCSKASNQIEKEKEYLSNKKAKLEDKKAKLEEQLNHCNTVSVKNLDNFEKAFFETIKAGDIEGVKNIINLGMHSNQMMNFYPLCYAARCNRLEIVKVLIENGFDVKATDVDGTPLMHAAINNHFEIVQFLLENGAEIDFEFDTLNTKLPPIALLCAILGNSIESAKLLIDAASDEEFFSLEYIWMESNSISRRFTSEDTPLLIAAKIGRSEIVKMLIEKGVNIHDVDGRDCPVISCVAGYCSKEVLKLLLSLGAEINPKDCSPLHMAASLGREDIVKFLIKKGANVNAVIKNNESSLHKAIESGNVNVVKILLDNNADYETGCEDGYLVLDRKFDDKIVSEFQEAKSICRSKKSIDVKMIEDASSPLILALEFASITDNYAIVNILLDYGAEYKYLKNKFEKDELIEITEKSNHPKLKELISENS